ncbi:sigma-70 family RNA polymerase sigma factor [Paenibacillus sp. HWE-109]|uniref:sigma-70 family RNA polymerase sigma factor n=1 Tax=Paenibacillus sp. HWE-109 TaxID=1306526 RepID=UPI001EE01511|nr:sigma-70 family RNA polymerase sigma factor [Paenibacillus sp. HWE-109]UKS25785.1 sigma-70 family RNA polymerase sigma factor [Paenibacillus sp. HWE-109]
MNEQELHERIKRMCEGDEESFRQVYEHIKLHVYRTVSLLVRNPADVNDVVSEIFTELFRSMPNYRYNKPFRSWLNGLIIRQASSWNRSLWRSFRLLDRSKHLNVSEPSVNVDDHILQDEEHQFLINLIIKLPYKQKSVLILRYFQDYSFEEMADMLNIPVGTVKSRHHSAIRTLRQKANLQDLIYPNKEGLLNV